MWKQANKQGEVPGASPLSDVSHYDLFMLYRSLASEKPSDLPSTSGTLPSQDRTSPAPGDSQLHSDLPPKLGTSQWQTDDVRNFLEMLGTNLRQSETLKFHNDQPPTREASFSEHHTWLSQLRDDSRSPNEVWRDWDQASRRGEVPGASPLSDVSHPDLVEQYRSSASDKPPTSGTPQLQDDLRHLPDTPKSSASAIETLHLLNQLLQSGKILLQDLHRPH
jgi:hypothetical protein